MSSVLCTLVAACGGGGGGEANTPAANPPASPPAMPQPTGKPFVNATAASNIRYVVDMTPAYVTENQIQDMTFGGSAAGDCDADGDVDLFITYGDGGPNRLYLNQLDSGNPLQFHDTAAAAGVANTRPDGRNNRHSGPTFADMDGDGDLDLFIGGLFGDTNKLYENRGDCTFEDRTAGSGLDSLFTDNTISAAFGDYDLDGDLDLFLTHWGSPDEFSPDADSEHLFRNISDDQGIRFENVSASTGITAHLVERRFLSEKGAMTDFTFTPTFARIDGDVWPDIALAADFGTAQLLLNDIAASGTFVDATNDAVRSVQFGMGSALGDIDFDGDLDWFVTSIYTSGSDNTAADRPTGNRLYRNPGEDFSQSGFENITDAAGVADGGWGWAACFLDIDNDSDLDIYHTNGWHALFEGEYFVLDKSRVFVSDGAGSFTDRAETLGLDDTRNARGIVCADFDNDGDVDILQLTNNPANSAALWENDRAAAGNNFLRVKLVGLPPNTEAAGARIFVTVGSRTQMREITIGSNYTSQNPTTQIFGIGTDTVVDTLTVEWPAVMPDIDQPTKWAKENVSAGLAGETLLVCHPNLLSAPTACMPPD